MRCMLTPLLSCLLALMVPATALHAQSVRQLSGTLEPGGRFQMAVPEGWQAGGPLIVYNHGFTLDSGDLLDDPELAPADVMLAEWLQRGYAVAAGSYAQRGWAVFSLAAHQDALLQRFIAEAGQPGRIVLVGGSLGGLVSVKTAERFLAAGQPVDGVLALCPALAGARTWDRAADLKLVFDTVCAGVGGGQIDRGSSAPEWVLDYAQIPPDWSNKQDPEVQRLAARVYQCTGVVPGMPELPRSPGQQQRLERIADLFGITDTELFISNMAYAAFALSDLVRGPDKLRGYSPFDNRNVEYGDPVVDAGIERVAADPYARAELRALSDPTFELGEARLLAIHTSGDQLLVPEHLSVLQPLAAQRDTIASALVVEEIPSHCEFSKGEVLAGFDALEEWMDGAPEPTAQTLDARCEVLAVALGGVCRFAASGSLGSYDSRVPARGLPEHAAVQVAQSGTWFDPATNGEGFSVQVLPGARQAAITWYTYAPDGSGEQRWITGLGEIHGNAVLVQDAHTWSGGGFGEAFDPQAVAGERWGRLTFLMEDAVPGSGDLRRGRVRYEGPAGWGSGERVLSQITHDGCGSDAAGCDPAALPLHAYSGLWFRGEHAPGDGLFLQVDDQGLAVLAWYLYTPEGTPMWLVGTQPVGAGATSATFAMLRASGATFGAGFDPGDVQRSAWGSATLVFHSCGSATLSWDGDDAAGFADGAIALQRLTAAPEGSACAGD